MYKGTLITDLMATVKRAEIQAEQRIELRRTAEEQELQAIFAMQIPIEESQILSGAA
jgi:hypothetical protein